MEKIKKKNKTRNIIAFAGLTLMLVIFPAVSWYYLQRGLNYQKEARAELKDYGQVAGFEYPSSAATLMTQEDLKGNFTVATFINADDAAIKQKYLGLLSKLHEQFDLRPDVKFVTHVSSQFKNGNSLLDEITTEAKIKDFEQVWFLTEAADKLELQARQGYRLPLENKNFDQNTYMALVDTLGTIIQYYDFEDEARVKRLVEHLAMVIPKDIPEKPVKAVEEEK